MKYTQSELYYYFRKEIPKKFNPRIEFDSAFKTKIFIVDSEKLRIAEEISKFKLENIEFFINSHQEKFEKGEMCELERISFELISKLIILEKDAIPRVLIERNFNSKFNHFNFIIL
jgi:hypothetical protein